MFQFTLPLTVYKHSSHEKGKKMIETLHPSVLHGILCELLPVALVRLAACSKSLNQHIISACPLTIVRERLKYACWSLLQAGYCVHVRNTLASYISCANQSITFTYNQQMLHFDDIKNGQGDNKLATALRVHERILSHHHHTLQIHVDDIKTFGEVFDRYIIHAKARLQRSKRPTIRNREIETHFARCAERLYVSQVIR
jgi:hypothetical protein